LGARVVKASTYAVTKTSKASNASKQIMVNDTAWLVPGLVVSGSGVAGGAVIVSIDPNGSTINVDLATTNAISGTLTFTYTGYLLLSAPNGITTQGAIT